MGDQTSGNNLEGPESLFRQIVREESGNNNNLQETQININFTGNLAELARILNPQIERVRNQQGVQNVSSNFAF